nr:hypothetical protein CFP56_19339 [Quercus suber]
MIVTVELNIAVLAQTTFPEKLSLFLKDVLEGDAFIGEDLSASSVISAACRRYLRNAPLDDQRSSVCSYTPDKSLGLSRGDMLVS